MNIDEKLNLIIEELLKNPRNSQSQQIVIDITHTLKEKVTTTCIGPLPETKKMGMVTLYLGDKYAQFHEEFTQTADTNPELKPLIDYVTKRGWRNNLD